MSNARQGMLERPATSAGEIWMHFEIESSSELRGHVREHGDLCNVAVQGLDLRGETQLLLECVVEGAAFLGCVFEEAAREHVLAGGAVIFPRLPHLPYRPYRPSLYTVGELMLGYVRGKPESHTDCLDQRIYRYFDGLRKAEEQVPVVESLAQRMHDHAIDDALDDFVRAGGRQRKVVAVMGGHSMKRTDDGFVTVARIARALSRADDDILVTTGGGPGAMEAAHLGAWLSARADDALAEAMTLLSRAPDYKHPEWIESALEVRDAFPDGRDSLGIPTWFYGHEPPNLFATHIAKYFSNSLREDGLLAIARHGVIYSPGSAGTIQEIFQDATQNHYGVFGDVSPMVFFGTRYWTEVKPVYPLLCALAEGRQYGEMIAISDDVDEIVDFIRSHPPVPYRAD